jgi:hypothetical protein
VDDISRAFPYFLDTIELTRERRADAQLGVISVHFSGGGEWVSDALATLVFRTPATSGKAAACTTLPLLLASSNPQIVLAALQCDPDPQSPTECTIVGSSGCNMTVCSCAQYGCSCSFNCACRKCVWHN